MTPSGVRYVVSLKKQLNTLSLDAQNLLRHTTSKVTSKCQHTLTERPARSIISNPSRNGRNVNWKNKKATTPWHIPIHTNREISANCPDIIIRDEKDNDFLIINVTIPPERKKFTKVTNKLSKYKVLGICN